MNKIFAILAALVILLALTACSILGGGYDPQIWFAHQQRNQVLQEWRIFAAVHIQTPRASNVFGISWLQKNDVFDAYLIAPGSQKASAHIVGTSEAAEVFIFDKQDVDGVETVTIKDHYQGESVDLLVQEKLRLALPVAGLVYWLRGLEKPASRGASLVSVGNRNRIDYLLQDGWEISYSAYGKHEDFLLPERIRLASKQFPGLTIDMAITRWQFRDFDLR